MGQPEKKIEKLVSEVSSCTLCPLHITALNGVVYRGTPVTNCVMFVGEAPGVKEDLQGSPFVGPSGKLLDQLIEELGIKDYYITNVVKHIPRKGSTVRPPTQEEITSCIPYLEREIELLKPRLIVALGSTAVRSLANVEGVVKWKGQVLNTKYGPVLVLPHPSYYLRRGIHKYPEEDVELVRKFLVRYSERIQGPEKGEVYYPLHLHTTYSIADAYGTPKQYVERFMELGIDAAAITDHGTLAGVVEWTKVLDSSGIKPIIGEEIYISDGNERSKKRYHVTVLVKNETGWKNLLRLHYKAHREHFYYKPRALFEEVLEYSEGLIFLTGCPYTPFIEHPEWLEQLLERKNYQDVYVEVMPLEYYQEVFQRMLEYSQKYNLPVVVTNDIHYPRESDSNFRNLVLEITTHGKRAFQENIHHVLSWSEIVELATKFGYQKEWILKTKEVVEKIEFKIRPYEYFPLPSSGIRIEDLAAPEVGKEERWFLEIERLRKKKYYDYLLLIKDILNLARDMGIQYGPGRGSVGGSYVAYRLGIHKADPFKYDLLFDRFLSKSRFDAPDIDLDFEHIHQERLMEAVKDRYGENRVARVGSYSTWGERGAKNDLEKIVEKSKVKELVPSLVGQIRHRGIHAAGLLICGKNLYEYVPVEKSSGQMICAWDRDSLDYMKIPKVDILGLKTISILKQAVSMIGRELPQEFDDPQVYKKIFQKMNTVGVFQFGTSLVTGVARYADCFDDLVLINALVRPGAREFTSDWIDVKLGRKKPDYIHEKLRTITESTQGLILFQEQVMRIVNEIAGLSWEDAEKFRKVTAKTYDEKLLKSYHEKFVEGAVVNGIDRETAEKIYSVILDFSAYSFNRSHAVFYSMLGYWTAWLKCYYPVEFYLANLKYEIEPSRVAVLVNDMERNGFKVLPPDVNLSKRYFSYSKDTGFRIGLSYIKGIGESYVDTVVKQAPFRSLLEFVAKTKPNSGQIKALAAVGALDCFNVSRSYLYNNAEGVSKGIIGFFGTNVVEWNDKQKQLMFTKYLF